MAQKKKNEPGTATVVPSPASVVVSTASAEESGEKKTSSKSAEKSARSPRDLSVSSISPRGFWRCKRFWTPVPTHLDADELTEEEVERLRAEPNLRVE